MPVIDLPRGPVEYRRIDGSPGLAPLVFLHEGLGCVATWGRFPDRVAGATGRETLIYSRHGYGGSGPARTPRPVSYLHDEADEVLPDLLDRFGMRKPVLIGHSDGGSISLLHAARHPVTQLVVIAPHVFVEPETLAGIETMVRDYRRGPLRSRLARFHHDPEATFAAWTGVWRSPAFRRWNIEAELSAVHCPALLVQGERDQYGTWAQLTAIERATRGPVRSLALPGCGHTPHLEYPDELHAAVTEFLQAPVVAALPKSF